MLVSEPETQVGLAPHRPALLRVGYCGEWTTVQAGSVFTIGREGDLSIDDNPFLHRQLLRIERHEELWMIANVGTRLAVTVTDGDGRLQSWLSPGGRLPLVFGLTTIVFTAGPTTYEVLVHADLPVFESTAPASGGEGVTTTGDVTLTMTQKQLIVALAEPMLLREGTGMGEIPSSGKAAARLGWTITRFNRKLDNVCDKLDRIGVQGLRGGVQAFATNRRIRLVEYAIAARLVTRADLPLLDVRDDS